MQRVHPKTFHTKTLRHPCTTLTVAIFTLKTSVAEILPVQLAHSFPYSMQLIATGVFAETLHKTFSSNSLYLL